MFELPLKCHIYTQIEPLALKLVTFILRKNMNCCYNHAGIQQQTVTNYSSL